MALFGRDRRVGECLLLREEQKSGLRGPISVFDPERTLDLTGVWVNSRLFCRPLNRSKLLLFGNWQGTLAVEIK
jgi:hypothetical protein